MNSPPSAECRVATPEETAGCAVGTNSDLSQSQEPVRNGSSNSNDSGSSSSSESLSETNGQERPESVCDEAQNSRNEDGPAEVVFPESELATAAATADKQVVVASAGNENGVNGSEEKSGKVGEATKEEEEETPLQRRMSLRPRSAPKKYVDVESDSDEEVPIQKFPPDLPKDPLAIPLGKNSSIVLIRKPTGGGDSGASISPVKYGSPAASNNNQKSHGVKLTKVTRPPPELIKAPISQQQQHHAKLSVSPATTVTVVPRTTNRESNSSGN